MRISSRAIIFMDNKLLTIYREKEGRKYYVFPGGGLEKNETNEECVIREIKEEIGININVKKHSYKLISNRIDGLQHFFLCEYISGKTGTGDEKEYSKDRKGGIQIPTLIDINKIDDIDLLPVVIKEQLLKDIEKYGTYLDNITKEIIE